MSDNALHYLDTSVVLAWLLVDSDVLGGIQGQDYVASSRLLWTEVARGLHRALQTNRLAPEGMAQAQRRFAKLSTRIGRIEMSEAVLRRAEGPYPVVVRTLDAIHLASAERWLEYEGRVGEPGRLVMWSHDTRMNECGALLGFTTRL